MARYPIRLCLLISTFPPITAPKMLPLATWRLSVPNVKPVSSAAGLLGKASGCFAYCLAMYRRWNSMYTVKEVAELLGVSVHIVRYYDDKGLIL